MPIEQIVLTLAVKLWPVFLVIVLVCLIFSWIRVLLDSMSGRGL